MTPSLVCSRARRDALSAARPRRDDHAAPSAAANPRDGLARVRHERAPRDELVARDVALRGPRGGCHRASRAAGHRPVHFAVSRGASAARTPCRASAAPHRAREARLVVIGVPVARRVGRVDLVDQDERAVRARGPSRTSCPARIKPRASPRARARPRTRSRRELRGAIEEVGRDPAHREQLGARHTHVVIALLRLRRRREDRARQWLVLGHAVGAARGRRTSARRARTRTRSTSWSRPSGTRASRRARPAAACTRARSSRSGSGTRSVRFRRRGAPVCSNQNFASWFSTCPFSTGWSPRPRRTR